MSEPTLSQAYAKQKDRPAKIADVMGVADTLVALIAEATSLKPIRYLEARVIALEKADEKLLAPLQSQIDNLRQTLTKVLEQRTKTVFVKSEVPHGESELDGRIAALEARPASGPGVHYGGVYLKNVNYSEGTLVTRSGCLWLALQSTSATPGQDPASWKLVVKDGRDAK